MFLPLYVVERLMVSKKRLKLVRACNPTSQSAVRILTAFERPRVAMMFDHAGLVCIP